MNEDKFKILIDNFSPSLLAETFQRSHDFFRIKQNLLQAFSDKQFADFSQLGDFELEDNTNVVVICARSLTHLNERASRKAQYDISKKILKSFQKSRASIFVYYDSKGDFRISLIYADYIGIKVNYSTFRRFTYFVSKEQTNTTFFQQVAPLNFTNFQELKEIFSVEKVTKEFFKKYRDLFFELLEDFENNEAFQEVVIRKGITNTADFVKKLMGQIVFLYFVQKKGWLGVRPNETWGTGNQTYLRSLFEDCRKANKNYFNDYLEPLFYKALAEKNKNDYFEPFNCKIPFLNGGLFESVYEWEKTKINIPNKTIEKLLDFFDQYNFTVDENTPSDQEISVDPEMLGKIFENLLEVKDRKDKGAFYTPREIVHYMCRESLIQHLVSETTVPEERIRKLFEIKDTDLSVMVENEQKTKNVKELKEISEKIDLPLRNIKIVDPAVGSGAFPMGMLNEISSVRYFLNTNFLHKKNEVAKELSLYDIKKETLENCIYAVDIEPGAVEIAKLRFWLALIVEYESNDSNIAPPTLPNLDYKIMQGNSLLEEYEGVKLFDEKLLKQPLINAEIFSQENQVISKLQSELMQFYIKNPTWMQKGIHNDKPQEVIELETRLRDFLKQNKKIKEDSTEQKDLFTSTTADSKLIWDEIKSKHKRFFSESDREKKKDLRKQIDDLNWLLIESTLEEQKNTSALEKLKELKKTNIKPFFLWHLYFADVFEEKGGFDIVIGNPPYVRQEEIIIKEDLKKKYKIFNSVADLYTYFYENGFNLLRKDGVLAFITSSKFTRARYGLNLRKYLKENMCLKYIINFGEKHVFEAITNTMIFIATKVNSKDNTFSFSNEINAPDKVIFSQNDLQDSEWTIDKPVIINLKKKIENNGIPLIDWEVSVFRGLLTGYNAAYIIDTPAKNELCRREPKSSVLMKPIIRGRDIGRYRHNISGEWVIYIPWHFPLQDDPTITKASNIAEAAFSEDYPVVYEHLCKFKNKLNERNQDETGIRYEWYAMQRYAADYFENFSKEKIIWIELTDINKFSYSDREEYLLAGAFMMTGKSLKYLLAFLNSRLCLFYFSLICNSSGMATIQWKKFALEKVPVIKLSVNEQKPFIEIVDKILTITKSSDYLENPAKKEEVKEYEKQIDQLVYKLYDLKPKEIEIVENSSKK